ncbi:sulfatase-like hydrolase/transferase [Alteromonas sp. BMJM2]|uniref:sulfatase-like hydrolase/transferase n=1 Tax=Alteromonas sp. BMJM2 TaxID=2954241 RepID=UPI0022B3A378|nr:sulfatase-like hydrolase/transferase [Alteromonas sp. BMJM2]
MKNLMRYFYHLATCRGLGFLALLVFIFSYYKIKDFESNLLYGNTSFLIIEVLLCSVFYVFLKCFQKNNLRAKLYSLGLIFSYYSFYEFFFTQFGGVLKLQDFLLFSEFLDVLPLIGSIVLFILIFSPVALYLSNFSFVFSINKLLVPAVTVSIFSVVFSFPFNTKKSIYESIPIKSFSAEHVVAFYGVITTAIIFEFERQFFKDKLSKDGTFSSESISGLVNLPDKEFLEKKNIHMIIYESYIDVRRFTSIEIPDVLNDEINNSLLSSSSISIAPGFGNGTARSEFEILCGVPSLQLVSSIEFNLFEGEKIIDCLPSLLARQGFKTIASHPFKPNYYNRIKAYQTLSFNEIRFGEKYSKILGGIKIDDAPAGWLFDKSLFNQNLSLVKENLDKGNLIFNYVLTAYGHYPFERSEILRPSVINLEGVEPEVNRLLNQTYYRIKELKNYIKNLRQIDPKSLIIIVGDHLPPLTGGEIAYQKIGLRSSLKHDDSTEYSERTKYFESFATMLNSENENELPNISHFNLKNIILDNLYKKEFCKINDCNLKKTKKEYADEYMKLISTAF